MKWFGWVAGALLAAIGCAAAVTIGPDDWIDSPPQLLNPAGETVVVTNYGLLSYGLPLRVTASAENGEVFVGIGHAVDVDDYLRDTTAVGIDWFSPGGLTSHRQTSTSASLPATPTAVDFWRAKASGPGSQTVAGSFAGQPVEAVVSTGSGEPSPLRVSLGSQLAGAFAAAVSLIAIGLALLAFTSWRWWRARRTPTAVESTPPEPAPAHPLRALRTTLAVLVGWSVVLVGSGCSAEQLNTGMVPVPPRTELTRDPVDGLDLAALAADYDRRNNAAIAAAAWPRYSVKEWAQADGELLLASDRFDTAWDEARKIKSSPSPAHTTAFRAYGVPGLGYPLSIIVNGGFAEREPAKDTELSVFVRQHSYSPWLQISAANLQGNPPQPAGPGTVTEAESAAANATAAQLLEWLHNGQVVPVTPTKEMRKWRSEALKPWKWATKELTVELNRDAIKTARIADGTLTAVSAVVTQRFTAKRGAVISWVPPLDRIYQQRGERRILTANFGLSMVYTIIGGRTSIIGWKVRNYAP